MTHGEKYKGSGTHAQDAGFSFLELMVALVILLSVAGIVMTAITQMSLTQGTIGNRTEMHSAVRSATEVIQQEIGQAGRLPALSQAVSLAAAPVTVLGVTTATVTCVGVTNCTSGMFNGELLQIDAGQMGNNGVAPTCPVTYQNPETVAISNIVGNTFQANFTNLHCSGAPVAVLGAFPSGIIPTDALAASHPSTDKYLRMFGDINGDGNIVYVEYYCDTSGGNLTRSVTPYDQTLKNPGVTILGNITANPNNTACFQYQLKPSGQGTSSVVDVTVTLTVNTQSLDPQTHVQQQETKALLNVAPRNVFDAWLLGTGTVTSRLQPVPTNVTALAGQ